MQANKKYVEDMISALKLLESGASVSKIKAVTPYAYKIIDDLKEQGTLLGTADGFILDGDISGLILEYQAELDRLNRDEADRALQREATEKSMINSDKAIKQSNQANLIAVVALIVAIASLLWQALR